MGQNTSQARTGNYGKYTRGQYTNGQFYWIDKNGNYLDKEDIDGNWIYKKDGTRVHISARKANQQATRTQPITNSSVAFSPISPEYRELYKDQDQKSIVTPPTTQQSNKIRRRVSPRINRPNYAANFAGMNFTDEEKKYILDAGYDPTNAKSVQDFILKYNKNADLGSRKGIGTSDGFWGDKSIAAFKALREQGIFTPKVDEQEKPIVEQPVLDASDPFGYKTSNTYEEDDFASKLKKMGIRSNADLINFMHNSGKADWKGDEWRTQFRSDVDRALGGDYSDANIRRVFNTKNNWGGGFMGRGDYGDFQNALQTNAGVWNGIYDAKQNEAKMNIARQQYATKLAQQFAVPQLPKPTVEYPSNKFTIGKIQTNTLGNQPSLSKDWAGFDASLAEGII